MSPDKKASRPACDRTAHHQTGEEVTTGVLSTAAGVICFLVAFTFCSGTEQLLLISLGGMLIGGSR
jgi:hypothetical protein